MERVLFRSILICFQFGSIGLAFAGAVQAQVVINEVLYDPAGADTGKEWIELHSPGSRSLSGFTLEFGNGSRPGQWSVVWTGSGADGIEGGGTFLIGNRDSGPVDAEVNLSLQNGPDGLRLLLDGEEVDRIGWGDLEFPEYFERSPASRSGSGKSLARITDGVDTNDNSRDFTPSLPSPGRTNAPAIDMAVFLEFPGRNLPIPALATTRSLALRLENLGREYVERARIRIWVAGREMEFPLPGLDPGASWSTDLAVPLSETATVRSVATVSCQGDEVSSNDEAEVLSARLPGPLRFRRIHPRPETGRPEWIELEALDVLASLSGWRVEDAGGGAFLFDDSNLPWTLGDLRRVTSATESSDRSVEDLSGRGWPTLNDVEKADGSADTLFLIDPDGLVRDWAAFAALERGQTWLRVAGAPTPAGASEWVLEAADGGAHPSGQGALPSARPWDGERPYVSLAEDTGGVWFAIPLSGSYSLEVFDLLGRSMWRASGLAAAGRANSTRWDGRDRNGRDCAEGVYVLQTYTRFDGGRPLRNEQTVVLGR